MENAKTDRLTAMLRRVYALLSAAERRRLMRVWASIVANSAVELLGLAVVVPVIGLVMAPEEEEPWVSALLVWSGQIGIHTRPAFLLALCALLVAAFLFKALFGLAVTRFQTRFAFGISHRLSGAMWTHHFTSSLERLRSTESGQLQAEINLWPLTFANTFLLGGLLVVNEAVVLAFIGGALLVYNPLALIGIGSLLAAGAATIRWTTRRRLKAFSAARQELDPRQNTLISNALRGFLEVLTFRASASVKAAYLKERWAILDIASRMSVLNKAPAKLYEVLAVGAISGAIGLSLLQGYTGSGAFGELLSVLAVSAYRVMPSMSRVNGALLAMRAQAHVLEAMESGAGAVVGETEGEVGLTMRGVRVELDAVSAGYAERGELVLDRFNAAFASGQIHAITGPSGSGKSTLINALLGLQPLSGGHVRLHSSAGDHILGTDLTCHAWLHQTAYLSQHPFLYHGTVRDNLTLGVAGRTVNEAEFLRLAERLELTGALGPHPLEFLLNEGGSNLSGGQQQRLAVLRALLLHRPVLILDEATSALDERLRDAVFGLLREEAAKGHLIILVTHDLELAHRCDQIVELLPPSPTAPHLPSPNLD